MENEEGGSGRRSANYVVDGAVYVTRSNSVAENDVQNRTSRLVTALSRSLYVTVRF